MPECIRIVELWTVQADSTNSPRHDRLEALVHQLDADNRPRDPYARQSARLLGVLDERSRAATG
ncbi:MULTISPECIES: hypothetical protein [unclassified Bradyrhizobium]|uniref:hypothetical protein n=1 Tax=unclassified Bradyrhizobium TaxID=2631580 RepID=UPI001A932921|nr:MULTISPECIES: hypothetical protein [unclassified Bradyrhizobium]MDI4237518.1 hypothetical protein [Bradyrhizobium sp. Arg237L]